MNTYRPNDALELLIRKLQDRDAILVTLVRDAINAGKEDTLPINSRGIHSQAEKPHEYRKIVPFSTEESLQVALDVLQALLIEQPLLVNEIAKNFADTFEIQIERHTETQIVEEDGHDGHEFTLTQIPVEDIEEQRRNLASLKELITFSGE